MVSKTYTVAFSGIDVLPVKTEVQLTNGLPVFTIVGLADKAITESKERVRSALHAIGLSLPAKHITVNLAPADLVKEGTHYDLPIAMAILAGMDVLSAGAIENYMMMGELGLDGSIRPVSGILPASMAAKGKEMGFICPAEQGSEAVWSGNNQILAPANLVALLNHFKGRQLLARPEMKPSLPEVGLPDMKDVKGQETAKRALEICAIGGHNVLMVGPPGSGKSMLASRLPSIMPPLRSEEILEISKIHSVAGLLKEGRLMTHRPFRDPHHSASTPALVGGGLKAKPGEVSLAHHGILFLDELPEFSRHSLEALRQPLETGQVSVSRANSHVVYPAQFQLVAAMNPCRCGNLGIKGHECPRAPRCAQEYQAKLSGPLLDRIDLQIDVPAVPPWQLKETRGGESSADILKHVMAVLEFSAPRFQNMPISKNAQADGVVLEEIAHLSDEAKNLLVQAAEKWLFSARSYHRLIRIARTIADMEFSDEIKKNHMAEALSFRRRIGQKEE